jgi:YD repeat-containing protein
MNFLKAFTFIGVVLCSISAQELASNSIDTTVLLRIDNYRLEKDTWVDNKRIDFTYDKQGKMSGWTTYLVSEKKMDHTAYVKYRSNGELDRVSIERDIYYGVEINEYYFSNGQSYSYLYNQAEQNVYDIENDTITGIDSMHSFKITKYPQTGIMDTTGGTIRYYLHKGNSVIVLCSLRLANGTLTTCQLNFENQYHFNSTGQCDSIVVKTIPCKAPEFYEGCFHLGRENGRVTTKSYVYANGVVTDMIHVNYLPNGQVASYLVERKNSAYDSVFVTEKLQFIYGPVHTGNILKCQSNRNKTTPQMLLNKDNLLLTIPDGMKIHEASLYDFRGRLISRFNTLYSTGKKRVIFKIPSIGTAVSFIKVSTNQGEFTFKTTVMSAESSSIYH